MEIEIICILKLSRVEWCIFIQFEGSGVPADVDCPSDLPSSWNFRTSRTSLSSLFRCVCVCVTKNKLKFPLFDRGNSFLLFRWGACSEVPAQIKVSLFMTLLVG